MTQYGGSSRLCSVIHLWFNYRDSNQSIHLNVWTKLYVWNTEREELENHLKGQEIFRVLKAFKLLWNQMTCHQFRILVGVGLNAELTLQSTSWQHLLCFEGFIPFCLPAGVDPGRERGSNPDPPKMSPRRVWINRSRPKLFPSGSDRVYRNLFEIWTSTDTCWSGHFPKWGFGRPGVYPSNSSLTWPLMNCWPAVLPFCVVDQNSGVSDPFSDLTSLKLPSPKARTEVSFAPRQDCPTQVLRCQNSYKFPVSVRFSTRSWKCSDRAEASHPNTVPWIRTQRAFCYFVEKHRVKLVRVELWTGWVSISARHTLRCRTLVLGEILQ